LKLEKDKKKQDQVIFSENKNEVLGKKINKVAVIGTGVIGASWATLFAMEGFEVNLQDIKEEYLKQALEDITHNLKFLIKNKLLKENLKDILNRVFPLADLSEALEGVDYVQESVIENYEIKKKVFAQMDSICPEEIILASSSSGLSMSEIQKATKRPQRCLIAHPFNPPHLMPLVELVPGEKTSLEVIKRAYQFYLMLGKTPLKIKKEVPGHIVNRLCAALWREAIDLVDKGVASVEDVDLAICKGPGLRWALMGPHLSYHLGGGRGGIEWFIKHLGPAFETWWSSMSNWTSFPPLAAKKLVEGVKEEAGTRSLEELCSWRNDKLVSILKIISDSPTSPPVEKK